MELYISLYIHYKLTMYNMRHIYIEVEAILTLVFQVWNHSLQVLKSSSRHLFESCRLVADIRQFLRAHGAKPTTTNKCIQGMNLG